MCFRRRFRLETDIYQNILESDFDFEVGYPASRNTRPYSKLTIHSDVTNLTEKDLI